MHTQSANLAAAKAAVKVAEANITAQEAQVARLTVLTVSRRSARPSTAW